MRAMELNNVRRVRRVYRDGGPSLVLRRALSELSCTVVLYELALDRELAAVSSDLALDVRPLSEADVTAYLELRPDEEREDVHARLSRGDVGLGAWTDDVLVGAAWARFDRMWVSEHGRALALRPGEAYGYASFTDPRYRLRGAAAVLYEATLRHLRTLGYERVLAYVVVGNEAGRRALEKLRFEPVGRIRWLHLGRYGIAVELRRGRRRLRVHVRAPQNASMRKAGWTSS